MRLIQSDISGIPVIVLVLVVSICVLIRYQPEHSPPSPCPGLVCDSELFESLDHGLFEATGYAIGPPYASIARSGRPVVNRGFILIGSVTVFTVAVDPNVIPLGSVLWLDGLGIGMASDTGRMIKGRRIDICFKTMTDACHFGRKSIDVTMLRRGR